MIRPMYDRIVLDILPAERTTSSGLLIPDTHRSDTALATVIETGNGIVTKSGAVVPPVVVPGDTVLIKVPCGTSVEVDGRTYVVVHEREIYGIVQ